MKKVIKQVMNALTLVFLIGILMIVTGDLVSERVAKMEYIDAVLVFSIYTLLASIIKWLIGWIGCTIKVPFIGNTLSIGVLGVYFEILLILLTILLLPLTGDISA